MNPLELRQLLFNLVINASEAIRPGTGRISIDTGDLWADAELLATGRGAPDLREGRYAMLSVCDSGRQLDAESLSRLFDPLLTTKLPGRALGLASALGAVRRHGGWIGAGQDPADAARASGCCSRSRPSRRASRASRSRPSSSSPRSPSRRAARA